MLQSHGMPPLKPKLPTNLVWVCRRLTKSGCCLLTDQNLCRDTFSRQLGQFACLDGHRPNHSMLFLQIHEFVLTQLCSMSNMLEKWSQKTKIQSSQIGRIYEVSRKYLAERFLKQCLYQSNFEFCFQTGFGSDNWSRFGTRN